MPTEMEIYTCNVDGSDLKQVTHLGKANWAPFFTPDGKHIIFSSNHAGTRGFDFNLYLIVLATMSVIAAGYIINNFYDAEKDKINKPIKSKIDSIVGQRTKLNIYFFLNFLGVFFALLVSWRAALFFTVYIFLIWFYSHKLKKYPLTGLFSGAILALLPFFVIFIYYKNFSEIIFTHAAFLFFILMIRELIKDLENIKGDVVQNYMTIPVKYGEYFTKLLITLIVLLTLDPIYFLLHYPEIGMMRFYFYFVRKSVH